MGRPTDIGVLAGYRFLAEPGVDPHGWLGALCATAPVIREEDGRQATAHVVLDVTERLLRRRLLADASAVRAVLARLASPYLSAVLDHTVDGAGRPILFTEPFGPSLAAELADRGPLPVAEVMAAAEAAGAALTALHGAGRLHHVVSPRALLRSPGNRIQLACPAVPVLAEQVAADRDGTGHEPPEVLTSGEWTPVGEVYALASTLWHLLAGIPPTSGTQEERLAKLHAAERPTLSRPDVPEHVRAALTAALAVDPADRPADVAELVGLVTGRPAHPAHPLSQHETQPPDRPAHVQGRALGSNYWLEERIGAGGSGVVYRARRVADGAIVAAKLLRVERTEDRVEVARFLGERTTVRKLAHPHLVKVHDLITEGDDMAIVMDFVDGLDLRKLIGSPGLGRADRLRLLGQVADALATVHDANVVHRDIKPENVLVRGTGAEPWALLTDFGLAKGLDQPTITHQSQLLGTMAYVAPELVHGRGATPASDVYSFGVTAYELLARYRPFADGTPAERMRAHIEGKIRRPPGFTDAEWALVSRCLARDPTARPTARQASARLFALAAEAGTAAPDRVDDDGERPTDPGTTQAVSAPWVVVDPLPAPVRDVPVDEAQLTEEATRPVLPTPAAPPARHGHGRPRWPLATALLATAIVGTTIGLLLPHGDDEDGRATNTPPTTGSSPSTTAGPASGTSNAPPIYPIPVRAEVNTNGRIVLRWSADAEELPGFERYAVLRDGRPVYEPTAGTLRYVDPEPGNDPCYVVLALGVTAAPPSPFPPPECPNR